MSRYILALAVLAAAFQYTPASAEDVLAKRVLRVGTVLGPGDLRLNDGIEATELLEDLYGLEVRRAIYTGRPVSRDLLGPPTLIRRNEVVTMVYRSGGLGLRTQGRALGAGGLGEYVEVMKVRVRITGLRMVEAGQ